MATALRPTNPNTNNKGRINWIAWAQAAYREEQKAYERYEKYYLGEHLLEFATDRWESVFKDTFKEFADNWCGVVVDALAQRMEITGWKSNNDSASGKNLAKKAQEIWERNHLEIEEEQLYVSTITKGDGYLMAWEGDNLPGDDGKPRKGADILFHDAGDINVAYNPANRREVVRGSKIWQDEQGQSHMRLYFPDRIEQWIVPIGENVSFFTQFLPDLQDRNNIPEGWEKEADDLPNPYGVVPIIHFRNRQRNSTHGLSEIKAVIPVQNAVNKLFMDMMVASEFGSFRQKWMAGGGHPKQGWTAGASRMWATTDPSAKFGEFDQTDLEPIIKAIEMSIMHIAKMTQTPMHYLRTSGDMPSGEALKTAESGLVHKAENRAKVWGRSWTQAMMLALRIEDNADINANDYVVPVWRSPETRHDLEQAQTAQLKSLLGIPLENLWSEHFGYTEDQIEEFKKQNKAIAASVLADVLAQSGQMPPGTDDATGLLPEGFDAPQLLALLGKGVTSKTSAGEATPSPQPNTGPPASPTRRGTGFRD